MSDIVIRAEHLSKRYRIGSRERYKALRDTLTDFLSAPFKRIRSAASCSQTPSTANPNTIWALQDVSFEIKRGEVIGVIGRNGAGKTTLLKILSRITTPTEGHADIHGRVSPLLEVGTGFHPELTGRDNIYLNGAILGMKRAEISRKFDQIVSFAELERFLDTPVKRYSSGMYMRLAFSVAAHLEPEILLVDEVLAVGDYAFQKKCLGKMEETAKQGRTVLFVSHNMPAITRLSTRTLLLESGRLVQEGTPVEVTSTYLAMTSGISNLRSWPNDAELGTEEVRLKSVALLKADGTPTSVVEVAEPVKLRIAYRVGKPNVSFRCAAMFHTQGVCAFTSLEPTEIKRETTGDYYSILNLPPHLLAEGEHTVGISIFNSRGAKQHYVQLKDAIIFQVFDSMTGSSARGDYAQNMLGIVRPLLKWERSVERRDSEKEYAEIISPNRAVH